MIPRTDNQQIAKYRAKNSFGGYDISNQIFYMDSEGNVLRYVNVNE
jgi:hypothetical protein